jgi:hypothetical protein
MNESILLRAEVEIQEVAPEQWNALVTEILKRIRGINETRGGIETVSVVQEDAGTDNANRTGGE